jgi:RNA polymerase sigma-70 factor (ECF subfamily)
VTREDEKRLVEKASGGDAAAFETLVAENQTRVYNLALRLVGNEQDALDMSQEAFIKAFTYIGSFRGESRFSVWLYRLTTNVCLDFLRSQSRRAHGSLTQAGDEDEEGRELEIPDERFTPQSMAERRELREAVRRNLEKLPPDYKAILILREIEALSYEELAETLDLQQGTVKSRLFRARKKLCQVLLSDRNFSYEPSSNTREEV